MTEEMHPSQEGEEDQKPIKETGQYFQQLEAEKVLPYLGILRYFILVIFLLIFNDMQVRQSKDMEMAKYNFYPSG